MTASLFERTRSTAEMEAVLDDATGSPAAPLDVDVDAGAARAGALVQIQLDALQRQPEEPLS